MKYKHCDTPSLPGYHQVANDNSEIKFSLLPDEIVIPILYLIFHYSLVYMQISRRVSISSSDSVKSVNGNCRELVLFVSFGSCLFHSFEVIILWNKLNQTNGNVWSFRTASPPGIMVQYYQYWQRKLTHKLGLFLLPILMLATRIKQIYKKYNTKI